MTTATLTKTENLYTDFEYTQFTESEASNLDEVKNYLDFWYNAYEGGESYLDWLREDSTDKEFVDACWEAFYESQRLWNKGQLEVTSVEKDTDPENTGEEEEGRGTVYQYKVELTEKPDPVEEAVKATPAFQTAVDLFKRCDFYSTLWNNEDLGLCGWATGCLVEALAQHNLDDVALTHKQLQNLGFDVLDEVHRQWRTGAES